MMWIFETDRNRTMRRTGRVFLGCFLAVALLLPLGGCALFPFQVEGERPLLGAKGPQRKTVVAKEAPGRLIAADGTYCIVPASRFESVNVEDKVWCAWMAGF